MYTVKVGGIPVSKHNTLDDAEKAMKNEALKASRSGSTVTIKITIEDDNGNVAGNGTVLPPINVP